MWLSTEKSCSVSCVSCVRCCAREITSSVRECVQVSCPAAPAAVARPGPSGVRRFLLKTHEKRKHGRRYENALSSAVTSPPWLQSRSHSSAYWRMGELRGCYIEPNRPPLQARAFLWRRHWRRHGLRDLQHRDDSSMNKKRRRPQPERCLRLPLHLRTMRCSITGVIATHSGTQGQQ